MIRSEHKEQVEFIHKAKKYLRAVDKAEHIPLLFAIPNGGFRDTRTAGAMKMEGVRAGVPDLFFAYPSAYHTGLFIEMKKVSGGRVSDDQKKMMKLLSGRGYACVVAKGFQQALDYFVEYIEKGEIA